MTNILDRVSEASAARAHRNPFHPRTTQEFFAVLLATRLDDRAAVQHYADLAAEYSEEQLLVAYQRARRGGAYPLGRRFHAELERLQHRDSYYVPSKRLAAIRIDRRAVALAILHGTCIEYAQAKQLSSSFDKALTSAVGFVTTIIGKFDNVTTAAVERIPQGGEVQRVMIHQHVVRALSELAIGVAEIDRSDLLHDCGYPPLESRQELQGIASAIWPALDEEPGGPWIHDAAVLGLYVQTERLFNSLN